MKKFTFLVLFVFLFSVAKLFAGTYYWVGGTGKWSGYNTHWATASGGLIFHNQVPSFNDTVIFDSNSFSTPGDTVYLDSTQLFCNTMDWTGVTNNPVLSGGSPSVLNVYGSLLLSNNMTWSFSGTLNLTSINHGNVISTKGQFIDKLYIGNASGGSWTLLDSLHCDELRLIYGTLISGDQLIRVDFSAQFGADTLLLGTSDLYMNSCNIGAGKLDADSARFFCNTLYSSPGNWFHYTEAALIDAGSSFSTTASHFDKIIFPITGTLLCDSCFVDSLISYGLTNIDAGMHTNTINYARVDGDFLLEGNNIFDTLYLNNPGKTIMLEQGDTQTITGDIIFNSNCNNWISIKSSVQNLAATLSKAGGTINAAYLILQDIAATGGATFTANNSIALSNVSGWTINTPAPQNLYWVGGTGNWNDAAHWATNSGGTGGACVPSPLDNVFFDANSFASANDTLYFNTPTASCNTLNCTAVTNNACFAGTYSAGSQYLNVYGSLLFSANMQWLYTSNLTLCSTKQGNVIHTSGNLIKRLSIGTLPGGSWTLNDTLHCEDLYFSRGKLLSNNLPIYADYSAHLAGDTLLLGTSDLHIINCTAGTATLDADSAYFFCYFFGSTPGKSFHYVEAALIDAGNFNSGASSHFDKIVIGAGGSFLCDSCFVDSLVGNFFTGIDAGTGTNTINYAQINGELWVDGNNVFDTLFLNGAGKNVVLASGKTQTITGDIIFNSDCNNWITLKSTAQNSSAYLVKTNGAINASYLLLQDIAATGGAAFTANNSIALANVSGWTVSTPSPRNLYWVGGTGNWNDPAHWSVSSGGAAGACTPSPVDNVFFDTNSFPTVNDTLYFNTPIANCNTFNCTSVNNNPYFVQANLPVPAYVNVYGSLLLSANMQWNFTGYLTMRSVNQGNIINTAGNFIQRLYLGSLPGGSWTLTDSLHCEDLLFSSGKLISNNQLIRTDFISSFGGDTLLLGSSKLYFNTCNIGTSVLDADSAYIFCQSLYSSSGKSFHHVQSSLIDAGTNWSATAAHFDKIVFPITGTLICDSCFVDSLVSYGNTNIDAYTGTNFINYARTDGDLWLEGNNIFDTLYLSNQGKNVIIEQGSQQTITGLLYSNASAGFPVNMKSSSAGSIATIKKTTDTVCLDYFILQDMAVTGGAQFYAGINSTDMGNNSGWLWTSCSLPFTNVWPGDANYDLMANNTDIIYIGLAYGNTGYVRPGANLSYTAQPCQDWNTVFQNLTNVKNADCDGNGIVNAADTTAVSLNYGMSHPAKFGNFPAQPNATAPDLFFAPAQSNYAPGTWVSIPIHLGTGSNTASNFYGLAFRINYDATQVVPGSVGINYSGSWLTPSGNLVHLEKDFYASQYIELGMARTDHNNASGNGIIATLVFQVAPNATGGTINFSFSNVTAMDNMENTAAVNATSNSVNIDVGMEDILSEAYVGCFPNPFNSEINFVFGLKEKSNIKIDVISADGVEVRSFVKNEVPAGKQQLMYDCKELPAGIYFCRITIGNSLKVVKLVKR